MILTPVKSGLFAGLLGITLMGCTPVIGPLTQSFGRSQASARMNQTLNPEASANLQAVEGFGGEAAKLAIERYYSTFEQVPTQPTFVLPISN